MLNRCILSLSLVIAAASVLSCTVEQRNFGGGDGGGGGSSSTTGVVDCKQPEQCFDGVDNDCDGETDCADSDCVPSSICVDKPTNFELGVFVAQAGPCPDGFLAEESLLYRGLVGGDCGGCACEANPTDCKADLFYYTTAAACTNDVTQKLGTSAGKFGFSCDMNNPINSGSVYGARTGPFEVIQTCSPSGTAVPIPATWKESAKFCRATSVGGGCTGGQACVPKQEPKSQCAFTTGSAVCNGYATTMNDWFTGYTDSRSCSSCSCDASGGHCDNITMWLGSDYGCSQNIPIQEGQKTCSQVYAPPAFLEGKPGASTCTVHTELAGSLDPAGQLTICCLE